MSFVEGIYEHADPVRTALVCPGGQLRAPLGPCWLPWAFVAPPGPLRAPWTVVGSPLALVGRALVGPRGPSRAGA